MILALEAYLCCTYVQHCSFPLPCQAFLLCIPEKLSILCDSQVNIYGVNKNHILAINLLSWRDTCSSSVLRGSLELYTPKTQASFGIIRDVLKKKKKRVLSGIRRVFWGVMIHQHFDLIFLGAKT